MNGLFAGRSRGADNAHVLFDDMSRDPEPAAPVAPGAHDADDLAHFAWCADCRERAEAAALTMMALERMRHDVALAEPPADAWLRLRKRVTGRRRADKLTPRLSIGAVAMAAALATVLVVPAAFRPLEPGRFEESGPQPTLSLAAGVADSRAEERWLRNRQSLPRELEERLSTTEVVVRVDPRRFGEQTWLPGVTTPEPQPR